VNTFRQEVADRLNNLIKSTPNQSTKTIHESLAYMGYEVSEESIGKYRRNERSIPIEFLYLTSLILLKPVSYFLEGEEGDNKDLVLSSTLTPIKMINPRRINGLDKLEKNTFESKYIDKLLLKEDDRDKPLFGLIAHKRMGSLIKSGDLLLFQLIKYDYKGLAVEEPEDDYYIYATPYGVQIKYTRFLIDGTINIYDKKPKTITEEVIAENYEKGGGNFKIIGKIKYKFSEF